MTTDPLSAVRNATMAGIAISSEDGFYIMGNTKLADSTKTSFRRTLGSSDVYYYTVKDVVLFLQNYHLSTAEYRRKAAEVKATGIVEKDRQNLYGFLTGSIDDCPQIDHAAAAAYIQEELQKVRAKSKEERSKHKSESSRGGDEAGGDKSAEKHSKREHKRTFDQMSSEMSSVDKAIIEADKANLAKLRADEFCYYNRNTILNCDDATGFPAVLKIFNDKILKPKDQSKPTPAQGPSTQVAPTTATAPAPQRPIIIVPNAATSEININNIVSYLQDGVYVNPKDAAKNKQKVAVVQRPNPANPQQLLQYKIIDDAVSLTSDDWNRVVAVFVTGQTWQFKNWKYQEPVNLFQHVLGVHVVSETKTVAPIINTWNCKVLKVNQFKQHLNSSSQRDFWLMFDEFVRHNKPHLDPHRAVINK